MPVPTTESPYMSNELDGDRRQVVASVVKAAELLALFTRDEPVLRLGDLSRRLGWNRHTTARFVTTLTQIGWLDRIDRGREVFLRLGGGLLRYSPVVRAGSTLREEGRAALRELTAQTSHTTYLMWKRGAFAVCLERISGEQIQVMHFDIGDAHPLTRGGGAPAILAGQSEDAQEHILDSLEVSAAERANWYERAKAIRDNGYNVSRSEIVDGISSLGVALTSPAGRTVAAISLATVSERLSGQALADTVVVLRAAAARLSARLGVLGVLDDELGAAPINDVPVDFVGAGIEE
jgi:IclR family transcriptional regulator, KDG regulon repressor